MNSSQENILVSIILLYLNSEVCLCLIPFVLFLPRSYQNLCISPPSVSSSCTDNSLLSSFKSIFTLFTELFTLMKKQIHTLRPSHPYLRSMSV